MHRVTNAIAQWAKFSGNNKEHQDRGIRNVYFTVLPIERSMTLPTYLALRRLNKKYLSIFTELNGHCSLY